ncbi:Ethylene-responsive transcription factor CRF1 [Hordeum vulgare]|nr:Ethylene-responsive transcription factor CRF1 [Hordeum vulgare]
MRPLPLSRAPLFLPRHRPFASFSAVIRFDDMCLGLDTFETAHEAACTYDAAAWRLRRPRRKMNFPDMSMQERGQERAPPPWLIIEEDRHDNRRRERRLDIAEMDEEAMVLWHQHFPQDVANKNAFWVERRATRRAECADRRRRKALAISQCELGQASFFDEDDPRWEDAFLLTPEDTTEEEDDDSE